MTPAAIRGAGLSVLHALGGAIVLDALMGNCDRWNDGNIVYAAGQNGWYSLDYSYSFNQYQPTGIGDPLINFGEDARLRQTYFPEIIEAVRNDPTEFRQAIDAAEAISDADIDRLVSLLPNTHCSNADAGAICNFLNSRRSRIRGILIRWADYVSLAGII